MPEKVTTRIAVGLSMLFALFALVAWDHWSHHAWGISLLTLVPGISGGSETYARELCRALARVGGLRYRVFLPEIATDAG